MFVNKLRYTHNYFWINNIYKDIYDLGSTVSYKYNSKNPVVHDALIKITTGGTFIEKNTTKIIRSLPRSTLMSREETCFGDLLFFLHSHGGYYTHCHIDTKNSLGIKLEDMKILWKADLSKRSKYNDDHVLFTFQTSKEILNLMDKDEFIIYRNSNKGRIQFTHY